MNNRSRSNINIHRYKPYNSRSNIALHRIELEPPSGFNYDNTMGYNHFPPPSIPRYAQPRFGSISTPPPRFSCATLNKFSHQLFPPEVPNQKSKMFESRENFPNNNTDNDGDWLHNWIENSVKLKLHSKDQNIKLQTMQDNLLKVANLLSKLESLDALKTKETTIIESDKHINEIDTLKENISNILELLHSDEYKSAVKKILNDRRAKRKGSKTNCKLRKERKILQSNKKYHKSEAIDEWRRLLLEKKQDEEQEEKLKNEADKVLCEVHKKQEQAHKMISLLQKLDELRNTRIRSSLASGVPLAQHSSQIFNQIKGNVKEIIEAHLVNYQLEEKTLCIMMENMPIKVIFRKDRMPSELKIQQEIRQTLFGDSCTSRHSFDVNSPPDCPQSLTALVEVRRDWDTFLTRSVFASSIPVGWVVPPTNPSSLWNAFQCTQK